MNRLLLALALGLGLLGPLPASAQAQDQAALQRIRSAVQGHGRVRVIVELRLPSGAHTPEGFLGSQAAINTQRRDIANTAAQILSRLQASGTRLLHQYDSLPLMALEVDSTGLTQLEAAGLYVRRIFEDTVRYPVLYQSGPLVHAPQAWSSGFDGTGWAVAIIDTGVESTHPFLAGKVVSEACYVSSNGCPNGQSTQTGPGSAHPQNSNMYHGTHVAGIAAGNAPGAVPAPAAPLTSTSSGMGRGAQIIAIQVFQPSTLVAFTSDIIQGLNRVYALRSQFNIASVNMSLGGGGSSTTCDTSEAPTKSAIDQLRSVNIATVIAAGNSFNTDFISAPACISSAVSVGSTDKNDVVSSFSNVGSFLSLFAPGGSIDSSLLNGSYGVLSGTSMATPHVAGAWAVLRQAAPTATVTTVLNALQSTGVAITDTRTGPHYTKPRMVLDAALAALGPPVPTITSLSPTPVIAGGPNFTLTVNGTGFTATSVVQIGGSNRTTTFVSATQLTATILASDIAAPGAQGIRVFTPAPGGGTSSSVTLSVNNPGPTLSSIAPTSLTAWGPAFTLTVTGSGFVAVSTVQVNGAVRPTTYGSPTQLTAAIPASDLATGMSNLAITVSTPAPGGGTSSAISLALGQPSLAVSATNVTPNASVTATLSNPPGNPSDTIALALVGSSVTSSIQTVSVSTLPGTTSKAWTVTMPATPGQYEFRFFPNNGSVAAATSPAVTVASVVVSPPTVTAVAPTQGAQGAAVPVTITGTGFAAGATVSVSGTGVTVSSVTVGSTTQITATLSIASGAAAGARDVTVTNSGGGSGTLTGGFTVTTTVSGAATLTVAYNGKLRDRRYSEDPRA